MMQLRNMPTELKRVLKLCDSEKISYLLFKCEHVLEGQNKNLDVLLRTPEDYARAFHLLERQGYVLYLDETVESYKKMYVFFDGKILSAVHLHREVAWHGVLALDKDKIFERARGNIPSPEDSLLIHAAHALFENFKIKDYHQMLLEKYQREVRDWQYLDSQLLRFGWKKAFYDLIEHFSISPVTVLNAYGGRLLKEPLLFFTLSNKILRAWVQKLSWKRKGCLISLIGINGSGKSTTKEALLNRYTPLTNFVAGQYGYYFGWKQSTLGKVFSSFRHQDKKIFEKVSVEKTKNFDLFQEMLLLYVYSRFLFRYAKDIYPHLRRNKLVISDRYFYDLYGQYPYSQQSRILKLLPIPKPDRLFLLDLSVKNAMDRDKGGKAVRVVQPQEKLEGQRQRYLELAGKHNATVLNAEHNFEENISTIINTTWRGYLSSY